MKRLFLLIPILAFVGCAPLVVRGPTKLVTPQPDGTLKTNDIANGYVVGPAATAADPIVRAFGPWGELAASLAGIGLAAYVRVKNKQELAKHIDETEPKT